MASLGLIADGRPSADSLAGIGALDVLVVLDNAEHVIEAVAAASELILAGGPVARILATSRERLALDGELVWAVAPLAVAGPHASAAQLFRERARALGSVPDDAVVERIVQRLDGLPLAIEMAAAQLDTTTAEELADILDERLDDLRSPQRRVPSRHRSLADVLAWSEARLDDHEARTLAELSVFAGPVIAADIAGVLGRADRRRRRAPAGETIARPRRPILARRHASICSRRSVRSLVNDSRRPVGPTRWRDATPSGSWTPRAAPTRSCARPRKLMPSIASTRFVAELRAAHAWAAANDLDLAADLSAHLHIYAQTRFIDEPLVWAEQLLGRARRRPPAPSGSSGLGGDTRHPPW